MAAWPQPEELEIRRLMRKDLDALEQIEAAAYPFPWTRGIFADCIRVGYDCWGLELEGRLAGYGIFTLVTDEAHLLNICMRPDLHGQGMGLSLLHWLLHRAKEKGAVKMYLEVRPSNQRAIEIYQRSGFQQIGRRPNYYPAAGGREDAVVMVVGL